MTSVPRQRRPLRLPGFDYAQAGAYFVTICVKGKKSVLGRISDGEMVLSKYGMIAGTSWDNLTSRFVVVRSDVFVVMPNHLHGIIILVGAGSPRPLLPEANLDPAYDPESKGRAAIRDNNFRSAEIFEARGGETPPLPVLPTLGQIVAYFKYHSTAQINLVRQTPGAPIWQRGYYEHVIRDDSSLSRIREYITTNPLRWEMDRENPNSHGKDEFDSWLAAFKTKPG